jgi:hydroxymethylbilane synthase
MRLVVGTRGSPLSIVQTDEVIRLIHSRNPEIDIKKKIVLTSGDKMKFDSISSVGLRGIFEKEIDSALLKGEVDFAVHSLKDVPSLFDEGLEIAAIPKRRSPFDVLVSRGHTPLRDLPPGSVIGTRSLRRIIQLKRVRPDIKTTVLKGNVDTRIKKVEAGELDAVILSEAGIARLGMRSVISEKLALDDFIPAAGQGAIVVLTRRNHRILKQIFRNIDDSSSRAQILAERQLSIRIEGGCMAPMGVFARTRGRSLTLRACIYSVDRNRSIGVSIRGNISNPLGLGNQAADELLRSGGLDLIKQWRGVGL